MDDRPENSSGANGMTGAIGNVLEWRCHPAARRPWVTAAVTVFLLLLSAIVFFITDSKVFCFLALVVLFASLAKFYFPTGYRMTDKGVRVKTSMQTLDKDWGMYRSYYPDKNGVLLSPFVRRSRLENFRGMYVMFSDNRDEVLAFVREHIKTDDAGADSGLTEEKS